MALPITMHDVFLKHPLCVFVFSARGVILRYGLLWYATSFPSDPLACAWSSSSSHPGVWSSSKHWYILGVCHSKCVFLAKCSWPLLSRHLCRSRSSSGGKFPKFVFSFISSYPFSSFTSIMLWPLVACCRRLVCIFVCLCILCSSVLATVFRQMPAVGDVRRHFTRSSSPNLWKTNHNKHSEGSTMDFGNWKFSAGLASPNTNLWETYHNKQSKNLTARLSILLYPVLSLGPLESRGRVRFVPTPTTKILSQPDSKP